VRKQHDIVLLERLRQVKEERNRRTAKYHQLAKEFPDSTEIAAFCEQQVQRLKKRTEATDSGLLLLTKLLLTPRGENVKG
jgi:hypothetical protein